MKRAVTSSSNLFRRRLCPGSGRMEAKFSQGEESEYSKEGTLLHSLFMREHYDENTYATLTAEQKDTLSHANELAREFIEQFKGQRGIPEDAEFYVRYEQELNFVTEHGAVLFPGHADFIITWPDHGARVIVDAKMGFMEVEEAADNYQLCCYAVMAQQASPVGVCGVAIVQPRNFGPKRSTAIYYSDALYDAHSEIQRIFHESQKPDAPLNPTPYGCHFCSAKVACEAYQAAMQIEPSTTTAIETLDNERLEKLKLAISFADGIKQGVNDELRKRIEEGRMPGWKLKNTGSTREVVDSVEMFRAFVDRLSDCEGFSPSGYDATRETKWGALEDWVQKLTGWTQKQAKEYVKQVSSPYVTETPQAKAPVREKK